MSRLPEILGTRYRLATASEVRSWSYGQITAIRQSSRVGYHQQIGTLDDQRIFGPVRDFECACGNYRGQLHHRMVCDLCGVKVTVKEERRTRFGHIELPAPIPHPFLDESEQLNAVPVLPAVFFESSAGSELALAYDDLAGRVATDSVVSLSRLFCLLLPVVVFAHQWSLAESSLLAQGLALVIMADEPE